MDRIPEFYHEDFEADYAITNWGQGLEGIRHLAPTQRDAFPDYREEIEELIDAGDKIVVMLKIRGTRTGEYAGAPATGKAFELRDVTICTCKDGKIIRQAGVSDLLSCFLQLGLVELPKS